MCEIWCVRVVSVKLRKENAKNRDKKIKLKQNTQLYFFIRKVFNYVGSIQTSFSNTGQTDIALEFIFSDLPIWELVDTFRMFGNILFIIHKLNSLQKGFIKDSVHPLTA